MVMPAQSSFEDLLQSSQSSLRFMRLTNGDTEDNTELAIKLSILDSLRSSMKLWENFLLRLRISMALPRSDSVGLKAYEEDLAQANEFSSLVSNLCACVSFLTSSITLDYFTEQSEQSKQWNHLMLELRNLEGVLQSSAKELVDISRTKFDMAVADSNANQANSVKRLTIIAAIFLPLSLASSLLAMTESVKSIAAHWFDWVALWLAMGFIVALIYSVWVGITNLMARPLTGNIISETWDGLWKFAFPWLIPIFCIIVVSIWIGVFDGLQTTPEALRWGFVAFGGLILLRLLGFILLYSYRIFSYGVRRWHGKRRIYYLLMGAEFLFHLKRIGGDSGDLAVFVAYRFLPVGQPSAFTSLTFEMDQLHGSVERVLNAAARSRLTKRYLQIKIEYFRKVVEEVDSMQDQRPKEVLREIRNIAASNLQVQELLAGII